MIKKKISDFFKGNTRTVKAKKNIIASLFIKGASIVIGFVLVPITLNYLDQTRYGIWLTISSFLTWFTFFQIGLGNGLRNKLAEALAKKNYELGKTYVSTTYAILSIIMGLVAIVFFVANNLIDWTVILNADESMAKELSSLALIVFGFFFLRFVIKLIGMVLMADQRPAINNLFGPMGNLLSLILIYILTKTTQGSLIYLGLTLSISPLVVLTLASVYFYSTDYKRIAPSFYHIKIKYAKELMGLGIKFFFIQISALILFQSSNIIIAQFFGPAQVTPYNIAYKYFSIIQMIYIIIITPFWSAHTEAWAKQEFNWIKKSIKTLLKVWVAFVIFGILLFIFSRDVFNFWIGKEQMQKINIPWVLQLFLLIFFLVKSFGGIFTTFINGVGKIKIQMISLLIGSVVFIPLTIYLIKYLHFGIEAVVIATIVSNLFSPIIAPIQYYKIINKKAYGIWNK